MAENGAALGVLISVRFRRRMFQRQQMIIAIRIARPAVVAGLHDFRVPAARSSLTVTNSKPLARSAGIASGRAALV